MESEIIIPYTNFYDPFTKIKILEFRRFAELANDVMYKPHRLDYYAIVLITKGKGRHIVFDSDNELKAGEILMISSGYLHRFVDIGDMDGWTIAFTKDYFISTLKPSLVEENFKILNQLEGIVKLSGDKDYMCMIDQIMRMIHVESHSARNDSKQIILQHLSSALLQLLSRLVVANNLIVNNSLNKQKILAYNFVKLVQRHIGKERNVIFYLDLLGVSQSTLQKATRECLKKTPKEILDTELVLLAKKALANPLRRVQEISYDLGFKEPSNFSKYFKKQTGNSPDVFRDLF